MHFYLYCETATAVSAPSKMVFTNTQLLARYIRNQRRRRPGLLSHRPDESMILYEFDKGETPTRSCIAHCIAALVNGGCRVHESVKGPNRGRIAAVWIDSDDITDWLKDGPK